MVDVPSYVLLNYMLSTASLLHILVVFSVLART